MILKPEDVIEGELQDGRYFEGEVVRTLCNPAFNIFIAVLKLKPNKCSPTMIDKVSRCEMIHLPFAAVKFYGIIREGPPVEPRPNLSLGPTKLIS